MASKKKEATPAAPLAEESFAVAPSEPPPTQPEPMAEESDIVLCRVVHGAVWNDGKKYAVTEELILPRKDGEELQAAGVVVIR